MREDFPQQSDAELVQVYINSELERAEITLQQISIDIQNKTCTVTTNKKVPKEIKSDICQYSDYKGITVEFRP